MNIAFSLSMVCWLSHGCRMEWRVLVQCTAPALQWRPAGAPTVSLGGLPVEGRRSGSEHKRKILGGVS